LIFYSLNDGLISWNLLLIPRFLGASYWDLYNRDIIVVKSAGSSSIRAISHRSEVPLLVIIAVEGFM
jgi:hypothetical protein